MEELRLGISSEALQSAQDIHIDVSGAENSGKEAVMNGFLNVKKYPKEKVSYSMNRQLKIENEKYNVCLTTSTGQESLMGVSDVRYRKAQGCVFVYSIGSRESFELFQNIKESILRVKNTDHFPFLIIGFGTVSMERNVSTSEGQRLAERANCKFAEILRTRDIETTLINFIKETISFSALRQKDKEEEDSKVSEQFVGVIGDVFSGKTSLIKMATSGKAQLEYKETKACSPTPWKFTHNNENYVVGLVDTPGFAQSYPRELFGKVQALVMVYSVTSRQSFEQLGCLRELVLSAKGVSKLPTIMFATKTDLPEEMWQVTEEEGKELSEKYGCFGFSQVSLLGDSSELTNSIAQLLQEVKRCHTSSMEAFASLDRSGVLNKTSKSIKKFRHKTFIIKDGILYSTDGTITPKSSKLPLMEDTSVEMLPTDPGKNVFPFEVSNAAGKLFLSATCDEDRTSWIETIISNVALSNVLSNLLDDVVKVMLWEIINSPDLHAESEAEVGKVTPRSDRKKPLGSKVTRTKTDEKSPQSPPLEEKKSFRSTLKKGSFSGLVRRKSSSASSKNSPTLSSSKK